MQNTYEPQTNVHKKLTDSELYKLAQEYGLRAKQWLRKFEGLLPEIFRRRLYKRRGFASIHEFAGKLAGMSHEKTDKILRLANCLEDKPALKSLLELGKASYCKIEKVAYIATPETDAAWAEKVLKIPQQALEIYVQETRKINRLEVTPQSNFLPEKITAQFADQTGTLATDYPTISFKINPQLEYEFRLLKQKLEKERGEALGFAEVLQELIMVYGTVKNSVARAEGEKNIQKPRCVIQLCPKCIKEKANIIAEFSSPARTIPAEVRSFVAARQQNKCAFPNCEKPPEIFHHTRRFALMRNHDPDFIVHLCTPHERLLHAGLIQNEDLEPKLWKIRETHYLDENNDSNFTKSRIDAKVNEFRR